LPRLDPPAKQPSMYLPGVLGMAAIRKRSGKRRGPRPLITFAAAGTLRQRAAHAGAPGPERERAPQIPLSALHASSEPEPGRWPGALALLAAPAGFARPSARRAAASRPCPELRRQDRLQAAGGPPEKGEPFAPTPPYEEKRRSLPLHTEVLPVSKHGTCDGCGGSSSMPYSKRVVSMLLRKVPLPWIYIIM